MFFNVESAVERYEQLQIMQEPLSADANAGPVLRKVI
jgi:hypothetical protein